MEKHISGGAGQRVLINGDVSSLGKPGSPNKSAKLEDRVKEKCREKGWESWAASDQVVFLR